MKRPTKKQYRQAAIDNHYDEGTLEIDRAALVSVSPQDRGAYVQAWLWIPDDEVAEGSGTKK